MAAALTDTFDLGALKIDAGEARRLDLRVTLGEFEFGTDSYASVPDPVEVTLDLSRMTGEGWALRLRFNAALKGPCMRCLEPAEPSTEVDVREVEVPNGGDELSSPYMLGEVLDVAQWARDAFALALPVAVVCREDCAGLCAECGANLNDEPEHAHERAPDQRWAKLRELRFDPDD